MRFEIGQPEVAKDVPLHIWLEHGKAASVVLVVQRDGSRPVCILSVFDRGLYLFDISHDGTGLKTDENGKLPIL